MDSVMLHCTAFSFAKLVGADDATDIGLELTNHFSESKSHPWPPGNDKVL